jgi:hypothetical protein
VLTIKEKDPTVDGEPVDGFSDVNVKNICRIPVQSIKDPNINDDGDQHA